MIESTSPEEQAVFVAYAGQLIQKTSRVHFNLGQEIVITTEDKIRLCLTRHLSRIEKANAWVTPLGVLLTILVVFPTTSFQPFIFSADVWQAIFIISALLSFVWLVGTFRQSKGATSVRSLFKSIWYSQPPTVESVVADIKRTAIAREKPETEQPVLDKSSLLFHDTFTTFEGWEQYGSGQVSHSSDLSHTGRFSLKKSSQIGKGDPNGGFKEIGRSIGLGIAFSGWIYRPDQKTRGNADRLAMEDCNFNGYGFAVGHFNDEVWIERRQQGKPQRLGELFTCSLPRGEWYQFEFLMKAQGEFQLRFYDHSGSEIYTSPTVSDSKYNSFDRIVVHGGFTYYVDDLKIQAI